MEEETLSEVVSRAISDAGYLDQLNQLWNDLGYDENSIKQRKITVSKHLKDLFEQMVEEEQEVKDRVIKKIENGLQEAGILSKELDTVIDLEFSESLPLLALFEELQKRMSKYQQIKAQRMLRLDALRERESELCNALCIKHKQQHLNSIPTEEQLQTFDKYLREKADEKVRLEEIVHTTRMAIKSIMNELDIKPELEFEELVVSGQTFKLSKDNMAALKDLHQSLERRLEDTKASTAELREKLSLLWERLHEPREIRNDFVSAHVGHSVSTLRALKQEISRCEEKKRQNIMKFVEEVRHELKDWWEKCYYSEEEKSAFTHFHSTFYSEDLLEMHEREVDKLKNFYQTNLNIFELIKQRENLWARRAVLEESGQHPNRLFHNRGGELLREERERKTINKNLPKIETELMKLVAAYEAETGNAFLIFGQSLSDYIRNQKEMLEAEKEKEKMERKARNQPDGQFTGTMGNCKSTVGVKRTAAALGTPIGVKRGKIEPKSRQPLTTTIGSVNKASAQRLVRSTNKERDISIRKKKVARNIYNSTNKRDHTNNPDIIENTPDASTVASNLTYTDFQNHLEKTAACRSSVKPRHCLRELNTPNTLSVPMSVTSRLGTPGKTPARPVMSVARSNQRNPNATGIPRIHITQTPRSAKSPGPNLRTPRLTPARGKLPFLI